MQTKRARLYGALTLSLVAGTVAIPTLPATAAASPTLEATLVSCDLLGASDILVQASGLESGVTYTVRVALASDHSVVDAHTLSGDSPTASFQFDDVANGATYAISIANAANTLTASTTVTIPTCDLPTLSDDVTPDVPGEELLNTGAAPLVPALGGIGLVQFGIVLLCIAVARLRPRGA